MLDFAGNVDSEFDAGLVVGNIEKSLVERDGLYEVGVGVEDFVDLGRNLLIDLHSARHEDEVGAEFLGFDRRHSRAHTETAGFVASGRHHTAHIAMPHGNGLATKVGIVSLLHRSIEGIHVDMYDFAVHDIKSTFFATLKIFAPLGIVQVNLTLLSLVAKSQQSTVNS